MISVGSLAYSSYKLVASKTPAGIAFWGVRHVLNMDSFMEKFKKLSVKEGYYDNIQNPGNPVITGKLTVSHVV